MEIDLVAFWICLAAALGLFAYLSLWSTRPRYLQGIRNHEIWPLVSRFVAGAADQSVLILVAEPGPGLLQLKLRGAASADRKVELGLPRVDWSESVFGQVEQALKVRGYSTGVEGGKRCGTVREFLRAEAHGPPEQLTSAACDMVAAAVDVLEWGRDGTFTVVVEQPFSWREWVRRRSARAAGVS